MATLNPSILSYPVRLANIAYFVTNSPTAMNHVKQCLHYDPDSKPCRKLHKLFRALDKDLQKVRNFVEGGSFRQAIKILEGEKGLLVRFDEALDTASKPQEGGVPAIPAHFHPKTKSQARLDLYSLACKAAVGAGDFKKDKGMKWCDTVLEMDEGNADALVAQGEKMLKEERFEEAVRVFERAFENSGRSSQDVSSACSSGDKQG